MAVLIQDDGWFAGEAGASCRARHKHVPAAVTRWFWILLMMVLFLSVDADMAQSQAQPTEYEIKAAFVYNFAKFVEWPQEAFASAVAPIRLCVLGNHPVEPDLQRIVSGKMIGARPLQVEHVRQLQLKGCHVLFIGTSDNSRLAQVLEAVRGTNVLTVGDTPGFIEQGGVINFVVDQNRIRFEVNLKAAQDARLKLSSKLLNLAKAVEM